MLSSLGSGALPGAQYFGSRGFGKSQPSNALKGIPSHTLKGSTLASHSYAPAGKIDESYDVLSSSDSRQSWGGNYLPEPEARRSLMVTRNSQKRLSLLANNSSTTNSRTQERPWPGLSSSYDIRPSTSHDNYYYERSLSSKSEYHSDITSGDEESILDSPSSIFTNLSTISLDTMATGESSPVDSSDSSSESPRTPIQEAIPIHFPTDQHLADNMADNIVNAITASPEFAHSLTNNDSPSKKNSSPARSNSSVESSGSLRTRTRTVSRSDYRPSADVDYASPSAYMYADDGVLEDRLEAGLFRPPRLGPPSNRSDPRQSRGDSEGRSLTSYQQSPMGPGDLVASQGPPGLEFYHNAQGAPGTRMGPHQAPKRRHSDGDQTVRLPPAPARPEYNRSSSAPPPSRCVRWNKDLVAPSPIFASQRRKGWYNRRGDQLWTNDGAYRPPPSGQEYPLDLDCYPEYGQGWQNEDGVRIDIAHRLVPKQPLRSALKQPKARSRIVLDEPY